MSFILKFENLFGVIKSKYIDFSNKHWILDNFILSLITVLVSEFFSRRSLLEAVLFVVFSFPTALMSVMIVFSFISLSYVSKKRVFWKFFFSVFWIVLSFISWIMYSIRMMPFNFTDILLIPSTFTILPVYLSIWQMILIAAVSMGVLYLLVLIYKRVPKKTVVLKKSLLMFTIFTLLSLAYYFFASNVGIIDTKISGTVNKYNQNGFIYCFTSSAVDTGMREPKEYSTSELTNIIKDINDTDKTAKDKANIIFLQLESFFDVNKIKTLSYSENPIPIFTELLNSCSHGSLSVPSFSAGTANTEFEVITGMNTEFFGIGEYPYQTVVEDTVTESMAYYLSGMGYKTHAIHNNTASFYDRNLIYSNLGFDTFTSLEYMYGTEYNSLGWAKDVSLIPAISDCLDMTKDKDLIYTVGVQTHGTYPKEKKDDYKISVYGIEDMGIKNSIEYYVNELHEVDSFLGALISALELRDEPTVLVVFGDHKPGIEIEDYTLLYPDKYMTDYAIWSNFEMDHVVKDLESYQLYSYVFDRLSLSGGSISKLHQKYSFRENAEYMSAFELLQYDMIYGEKIGANGKFYTPTELKMGIRDIKINRLNILADSLYIHGSNFNEYSCIYINDTKLKTNYINSETLSSYDYKIKPDDIITVSQLDKNGRILSSSNKITYRRR